MRLAGITDWDTERKEAGRPVSPKQPHCSLAKMKMYQLHTDCELCPQARVAALVLAKVMDSLFLGC